MDNFLDNLFLKEFLKKIKNYDDNINMIFYGLPGCGKCHVKDTPILMYNGRTKLVQDVKVGDLLMGDNSMPRKVLSLARGQDDLYEVNNIKGDKYGCNSEHILCLKYSKKPQLFYDKKRNKYQITWFDSNEIKIKGKRFNNKKEAEIFKNTIKIKPINISIKKYFKLNKSIKNNLKGYKVAVNFKEKKINIDPYLIGFWLGDGSSRTSEITNQEAICLKYIKEKVKEYNCYLQHKSKYTYRINSIKNNKYNFFSRELRNLNLLNNKHIPYIYKCNSRENRLKLLAGLIDSDGHLQKNGGYSIIQKNEKLIDDIIYLCRSLGFSAYKKIKTSSLTYNRVKKYSTYFRIHINGEGIEKIPVLCPRKKSNKRMLNKDVLLSGIRINYIGYGDYYGFQLDGNHKYLLGNFIVTHNTTLTRNYLNEIYKKKENYLEINSSDYRGINYYKDILFDFINNKNIKKKTIFLDEVDNLTKDSQKYINYIIEYINLNDLEVNFIIVCNYINNLHINLINKFFTFRFKKIPNKVLKIHFDKLCIEKNLNIKNKNKIIKSFENDFRKLEQFFNLESYDKIFNYNKLFDNIFIILLNNNLNIKEKYNQINKLLENINLRDILDKFFKYCLNNISLNNSDLIDIFIKLQNNIQIDYNKKIKIYEIILYFNNI